MQVLTAAQMRQAEQDAVAAGTSLAQLMENAGTAAAKEILAFGTSLPRREALLLCGAGNNGGDAFVVARLLAEAGWQAACMLLCGEKLSELAAQNFGKLPPSVQVLGPEAAVYTAPLVVDGVFGTGFHGALPFAVRTAFQKANAATALRVALDVPSGLGCDDGVADRDTFRAALTLTFGALKPALLMPEAKALYGEVRCLDIGL